MSHLLGFYCNVMIWSTDLPPQLICRTLEYSQGKMLCN